METSGAGDGDYEGSSDETPAGSVMKKPRHLTRAKKGFFYFLQGGHGEAVS